MSKLDNPVWNSLNEIHQNQSINYNGIKFYNPEYCPFGGSIDFNDSISGITNYSNLNIFGSATFKSRFIQMIPIKNSK